MFTADLSGSITVNNVTGITKYIAALQPNYKGTFGNATSGVSLIQTVIVSLDDPYQSGAAGTIVVQAVSTTNQFRGAGLGTGTYSNCNGAAVSARWINCLAVPTGGNKIFTGMASATGTRSYLSTDADWINEQAGFLGTGAVSFTLDASPGILTSGTSSGVTFPASSATITGLTNGLEVLYTYTYDESPLDAPEPATLFLAGSAFLGLAFAWKTRAR